MMPSPQEIREIRVKIREAKKRHVLRVCSDCREVTLPQATCRHCGAKVIEADPSGGVIEHGLYIVYPKGTMPVWDSEELK